ncbi:methylated-DNA--[protein]-cysteine S-methyltransferase [Clostridium sp. WILCCON 0269]|uniref:Methylated-DNA--protein-cysteine methyltransferase n=1 Tax=Candidatus Clostridium eludens TaxID=3381663 RepID=A0ABW8SGD5_9CLOT
MENLYTCYYHSPIGIIKVDSDNIGITSILFLDNKPETISNGESCTYMKDCIQQLDEYFKGTRKDFSIKLHICGTPFREKVWNELMKIPYGQTCSYSDIANAISNEKALRAIGGANHHNKINIIIPCHRVIGKSGNLTGYGGGLWRKKWLLEHEQKYK